MMSSMSPEHSHIQPSLAFSTPLSTFPTVLASPTFFAHDPYLGMRPTTLYGTPFGTPTFVGHHGLLSSPYLPPSGAFENLRLSEQYAYPMAPGFVMQPQGFVQQPSMSLNAGATNSKTVWCAEHNHYHTEIPCPEVCFEDLRLELVGGRTLELFVESPVQVQDLATISGAPAPVAQPTPRHKVLLVADADTSQMTAKYEHGLVTVCYPRLLEIPAQEKSAEVTVCECEVNDCLTKLRNAKHELDEAACKHREALRKLDEVRNEFLLHKARERRLVPIDLRQSEEWDSRHAKETTETYQRFGVKPEREAETGHSDVSRSVETAF